MKQVGHQVLWLPTGEKNPRNGEGTFLRLKDGAILYLYTEYFGGGHDDHDNARLTGVYSHDEGESWSEPVVLIEKDPAAQNIMSPSLLRLPDGDLGVIYLRKEAVPGGGMTCMPVFRSSKDEGKSWSEPVFCIGIQGYYCAINDGAVVLKSGRIVSPMSYSGDGTKLLELEGETVFAYSDDCGRTWGELTRIRSPYADRFGLQEPGLMELPDGRLWTWARTGYGYQYQSFSSDGGVTWTAPEPNLHFSSPDSPMRVKPVGASAAAVFNPYASHVMREAKERWQSAKRTPLLLSLSADGGLSFDTTGKTLIHNVMKDFRQNSYLIESDESESCCYPAIQETADGLLIAYYHSGGTDWCLNCGKITKIYRSELDG